MRFRPCIDLHGGKVKQIVGSTLNDSIDQAPTTNFVADHPSSYYADIYRRDDLPGGHIILLGPGNEMAAHEALNAYPGGLQVGGGIKPENTGQWLDYGAQKVIVTSYLFPDGQFSEERADEMASIAGRDRLVIDLSCARVQDEYFIASQRWQTITSMRLDRRTLLDMEKYCGELLIHAVDVEGKQQGIDERLVELLGAECPLAVTYAGGIRHLADLDRIAVLGHNRVDATAGSSLDIFGGLGLRYEDVVLWNRRQKQG